MKRLGKFSGNIYEYDEVEIMNECGVCISDEQANDEEYINEHHLKDLMDCVTCMGCPRAQKGLI